MLNTFNLVGFPLATVMETELVLRVYHIYAIFMTYPCI